MSARKLEGRLLVFWPNEHRNRREELEVVSWLDTSDRRRFAKDVKYYRQHERWRHIRPGRFFIPESSTKKYPHYIWIEETP